AKNGVLRSESWVEAGLREAREIPGLDATDLSPRLTLLTDYALFQAERLKDNQTFSGKALASLDWNRKYDLSFVSEVVADAETLAGWIDELWDTFGGVSPEDEALEKLLVAPLPVWGKNLLPRAYLPEILHEAQQIYGGWLPRPVLTRIAHALKVPLSDVYGVTEFFTMFYTEPVGKKIIRICEDGPCLMRGAQAVQEALCKQLQVEPNHITADGEYTIEPVRCLGLCDYAPAAQVNETRHFEVSPDALETLLNNEPAPPAMHNRVGGLAKVALSNVHVVQPNSLDDYRAQGGLAALRKVLADLKPEAVIEVVKASKLVGRGGAAFPTGLKWQFTAANPPGPRYVICNADESEVGAFKDRVMMEGDPFRVLEGMIIACYAVEAEQGFFYIRGEHHDLYRRYVQAVADLEAAGWLGANIQGTDFTCRIAVRRGAGAYICGEETALMEAIEGKRGFPRLRPPFPTTHGLWGRPTVINNVETLSKVPPIIIHGGAWYQSLGTEESA
ncbi:MAG: NAD(P)H-dependent oxidoreductase subunit E, partial [Anaerolineae bacterium]|nr:NAD(P)H-dependent oxidoreductase subunit E [Anaerolineae bacterium]